MKSAALLSLVAIVPACSNAEVPISDLSTCIERVQTRLYQNREKLWAEQSRGPEFYVLRETQESDSSLAVSFMERHGWHAWASTKSEDEGLFYFVPDIEPYREGLPIGDLKDGPRLACQASKLSGLTFISVVRRSKDLSDVIYEFTP